MRKFFALTLALALFAMAIPALAAPEPLPIPIVTEPLTLTYFCGMDYGKIGVHTANYADMGGYKEMAKHTGITVEFIHPPAGQNAEKFNLMIASGDLPDMIFYDWLFGYTGGPQKALDEGIILPLNDMVNQWGPNIYAFLEENPDIRRMMVTDGGVFYGFPTIRYKQSILAPYGFQFRKDWFDKTGMEVPVTLDDWYALLKKVKELDPAGEGKTIPFNSYSFDGSQPSRGVRSFLWAYGIDFDWINLDGKAVYGPTQPAFKDWVTLMAQWYAEGLIDQDWAATKTNTDYDSKVYNSQTFAWFGGLGDTMGRYIAAFEKEGNKDFAVVPVAAPKLKADDPENGWNYTFDRIVSNNSAVVTTASKHPKEALQWLDYHFSPQGHLEMNWGVEGVSYTINAEGLPVFTEEITKNAKGYSVDVALGQYASGASGEAQILDARVREARMWALPIQREASQLWNQDQGPARLMPQVTLTSDESLVYTTKFNDIKSYALESVTKFIMGQTPLDQLDAFVAQLDAMGIQELTAIQQAALDRYNAR